MGWQALLLEPALLTALVGGRTSLLANRTDSVVSILVMLAACLSLVSILFFLAGGYIWLDNIYGAQVAVLVTGGIALGLAAVLFLGSWAILRYKSSRIAAYKTGITHSVESFVSTILQELEEPVRAYPKSAVSLAALAGYAAGDKMQDGTETLISAFERLRA